MNMPTEIQLTNEVVTAFGSFLALAVLLSFGFGFLRGKKEDSR